MPELPEVETIKTDLRSLLTKKTIQNILIHDPAVLTGFSPQGRPRRKVSIDQFKSNTIGKKIANFERRGKYLIMEFNDHSSIVFHLRMTGQLLMRESCVKARAIFQFDSKKLLSFIDRRRFGEMLYSKDWRSEDFVLSLGTEPLNGAFTAQYLKEQFWARTAPIHSLLLNQKIIAGIGNIYAAEALFQSRISPSKQAGKLTLVKLKTLVREVRKVLQKSIKNRGYSMNTYVDALGKKGKSQLFTSVYGKEGMPCPSCNHKLLKKSISGRGVVYCIRCQN